MEPIFGTWVYLELSELKLLPVPRAQRRPWGFGHQLITKSPEGTIHQNVMVLWLMNKLTWEKKHTHTHTSNELVLMLFASLIDATMEMLQ